MWCRNLSVCVAVHVLSETCWVKTESNNCRSQAQRKVRETLQVNGGPREVASVPAPWAETEMQHKMVASVPDPVMNGIYVFWGNLRHSVNNETDLGTEQFNIECGML